jgi:hypothetical protein
MRASDRVRKRVPDYCSGTFHYYAEKDFWPSLKNYISFGIAFRKRERQRDYDYSGD